MISHGSFADGTIPLSVEGIQSQIQLAQREYDQYADPILMAAESGLDRRTLELCVDERRKGNRLESWLLEAEADALGRMSDSVIIELCRAIRAGGGRLAESHHARFSQALLRRSLVDQGATVEP